MGLTMTIEDKNLLLKDLCGRLPYGVKAQYYGINEENTMYDTIDTINVIGNGTVEVGIGQYGLNIEDIKPYLFPITSMTAEQRREYAHIVVMSGNIATAQLVGMTVQDWFSKNHIDYRGLIPMGLAINATNLNIY
jgi:hypothetical protein